MLIHSDVLVDKEADFLVDSKQEFRVGHHVNKALNVGHRDVLHTANIEVKELASLLHMLRRDIRHLGETKQPRHSHTFPVISQTLKEIGIGPGTDEIAEALVLASAKDHFHVGVELTRLQQLLSRSWKERLGGEG